MRWADGKGESEEEGRDEGGSQTNHYLLFSYVFILCIIVHICSLGQLHAPAALTVNIPQLLGKTCEELLAAAAE